jgi:hypothetical protein
VRFDLVDRRHDLALVEDPLEMCDLEVRDADRANSAAGEDLLEGLPVST